MSVSIPAREPQFSDLLKNCEVTLERKSFDRKSISFDKFLFTVSAEPNLPNLSL